MAERSSLAEGGSADGAHVRLAVRVRERVRIHFMFLSESFSAMPADVRPLSGVFEAVPRQSGAHTKLRAAVPASVRERGTVGLEVHM